MKKTTTIILFFALLLITGCAQAVKQVPKFDDLEDNPVLDHTGLLDEQSERDAGAEPIKVGLGEGMLPPDFELTLSDGSKTTLRSLANDDEPAIIYFMATWCPYCAKDFGSLSEVYPEFEDDVQMFAYSLDLKESKELLDSYKSKYSGLGSLMLSPGEKDILKKYNVRFTTTKYAVGKDGSIIYAGSGPLNTEQWTTLLQTLAS